MNGLSGSITSRHDWFYFVNGVEGDRGAADYRLRAGDIAWWDYRDWGRSGMSVPIVVGAFPEPFVHGYDGKTRVTIVLGPKTAARATDRSARARDSASRLQRRRGSAAT